MAEAPDDIRAAAEPARVPAGGRGDRLHFLAEAGLILGSSLDYEKTLRSVAELAVPAVADWCVMDLLDDAGNLRLLAVAHADPAAIEATHRLWRQYRDDPEARHGADAVVRSGQPLLIEDVQQELLLEGAPAAGHLRTLKSLGLRSCIIVPLQARDRLLGAVTLGCATARCYGRDDLVMAQELAGRAGAAIDSARLIASLGATQQRLDRTAAAMEAQAEELQATVEELESTTQDLLEANEELIRERDRAEQALAAAEEARAAAEQAQATAEEASTAKSEFLATMSHELRTPLNAISGYAELIEIGVHGPVTEQQREALQRLRRAQKRLLSLVNDVLNFARLEAGQVHFDYGHISIEELFERLEAAVASRLAEREQVLAIEPVPAGMTAWADAEKVEQIMLNLLGNAIKFTPERGSIRLRARQAAGRVMLIVEDTGRGIPAHRLESIFEPFVQIQSGIRRDHGGVGLGLSISRDLAHGMNGDLTVESTLGAGATFTLLLPPHAP